MASKGLLRVRLHVSVRLRSKPWLPVGRTGIQVTILVSVCILKAFRAYLSGVIEDLTWPFTILKVIPFDVEAISGR